MDKKAAKQEALRRALESLSEDESYEKDDMEAHMAKCPNCGHEWMMGEDDEDDDDGYDAGEG